MGVRLPHAFDDLKDARALTVNSTSAAVGGQTLAMLSGLACLAGLRSRGGFVELSFVMMIAPIATANYFLLVVSFGCLVVRMKMRRRLKKARNNAKFVLALVAQLVEHGTFKAISRLPSKLQKTLKTTEKPRRNGCRVE